MYPIRFLSVPLLILFAIFIGSPESRAETKKKPNFLFLLADDQRPDTISAFGNSHISTPHLDTLAANGMSFSRATCSYPICHISRTEILSGTHGWENGHHGGSGATGISEEKVSWWASTLAASGYETFYVGKWHIPGNVLDRGFQKTRGFYRGGGGKWWKDQSDWKGFPITGYRGWIFQDPVDNTKFPEKGVGLTPDISSLFADAAIEVLEKDRKSDAPFFISVNFTAPHDPLFVPTGQEGKYKATDIPLPKNYLPIHPFDHGNFGGRDEALLAWPRTEEAVRDLLRVYYSVVADLDKQVGRIIAALEKSGELDNTYIIYSSDHGMSVGSHGLRGKQNMYEHTINVPLIIAGPEIEAGSKTDAQVYLREIYPTTCEIAGIPVPEKVTAKSFNSILKGNEKEHHETIFGYYSDAQRMIRRNDGWKLIYYPGLDKRQLFNVKNDPNEINDLSGKKEHSEIEADLEKELSEWRTRQGDPILKTN